MSALFSCLLLFITALFMSYSAWGQAGPYAPHKAGVAANITRDTSLDTLPRETFVPFNRQGNLILVQGAVNGKSVTMIFDTGAAGCLFSRDGLKSLKVAIPNNLEASTVAGIGPKRQTEAWVMPVDLKLGSIERRQFPVHINDNQLGYPLLGVNFLKGYEYTINTDSNIIQFKLVASINPPVSTSPPPASTKVGPKIIDASPTISFYSPELTAHLTSKPYITVDTRLSLRL